ncbi:MAG TPA: 50S ribosomal protein L24 [Thermoleophilaceae bacterium]|jgi:large subunit ribosomal protein L24|nr:50S ribosomal protein L24 [Thermoleophilaceae bacterium]
MATKLKVRKGDKVKVIAGKSAGHVGNVLRTDPHKQKVWVEGANVQKRHEKPRTLRDVQRGGQMGGIIEAEGPIHVSNVMLVDPSSNQPTRIALRRDDEGRRVRVAKRSGKDID